MATNFRTHSLQEQSAKSSHDGSRGMKRKAEPNGGEAVSKKKLRIDQAQSCGSIHNTGKDKCVALEQQYPVTRMKRRPLDVSDQIDHNSTLTAPRRRLDGPDDGFSKQKAHPTTEKTLPDLIIPIIERNSSLSMENYTESFDAKIASRITTASSANDQRRTIPQVATSSKQNIWLATMIKNVSTGVGFFSSSQCARLILGVLMIRHAIISATSSYYTINENIMSLVRGAFLTFLGIAAAGTFEDKILQRERLENLVQKRAQNLYMVNLALQASETAIAITDNSGYIIWVNGAFERLSGKTHESLLGLTLKNVICNLDTSRKENAHLLMESYEDPSNVSERDFKILDSVFRLEATPFSSESYRKDKSAQKDRFLMVFKDITATRARDIAEKKAQQEAMLAKAMSESMVTLTHELRTPLQGIMGVTSLLMQQTNDLTNDVVDSLKLIMASSTLLLNLINNLLDVKKENAKMMDNFPLSPISASEQIQDAVCFCQPLAFISNVKLVTDIRMDLNPIVNSNALRLQQVLINLVSNAIKYTRRESDIRIRIRSASLGEARRMISGSLAASHDVHHADDDDEMAVLVFSVSDCGPGIAPDQACRLFQQYAQLESRPTRTLGNSTVGQPSGTGVGLHLCRLFVNRMNGQIWATNNGRGIEGSTFSFYLPLVSCDKRNSVLGIPRPNRVTDFYANSSTNNRDNRDNRDEKDSPGLHYRVLVVDDILINRKVIGRMIKKVGISEFAIVDSGKNALEELARNHYDLVITDLQMPGMSGTELSANIRDSKTLSSTPIVIGLTASGDDATQCIESGMADLLYKPITVSEMKEYFEATVPNLKPGSWYKSIPTESNNCTAVGRDDVAKGKMQSGGASTPAQ